MEQLFPILLIAAGLAVIIIGLKLAKKLITLIIGIALILIAIYFLTGDTTILNMFNGTAG